ncbi:proteinase [Streptomyces cinnamoneus]|uniref:Proteinase n=1 Tax=Streptomyces cinnamoneus TaxID=53446 RepID=A0A2G1XGW2_STRCJ|nr:alpha/beta hydrolase [Streptomyces cinnamoneus]PHQ50484.1 proteinase [Streptomyces cinnamoneus]PPT14261.1 alpha/beta hydrolase [Streptomyces cinnamoneus]
MDTSRLLRTSGTLVAAAALLISAAVTGSAAPGGTGPDRPRGGLLGPVDDTGGSDAAPPPLAPLPTALPAALRPYYDQKLRWHACSGKRSGFECATMRAPLDYGAPRDGDVKLAVSRKKATGSGKRLGALMVNPGGPGGSAVGFLQQYAASRYPAPVRARYDMVAMDPRGVAASDPVTCLSDQEMDAYARVDQTPDSAAEVRDLVNAYKKFAAGCAARSGKLLRHVSTIEAARDMDIFRAVLGDDKLHYVGASYGTFLGATYAGLYPKRVGKLVLDGALDPSLSAEQINHDQTVGFQTAFASFVEDCAGHENCPLGSSRTDVANSRLKSFFEQLDDRPLPTGTSRELTESLATTGVISAMYDEGSWPVLRKALQNAQSGDGSLLLRLSDAYYERDERGAYTNLMPANSAVNCLDLPTAFHGPAGVYRALPDFEKASPALGTSFAWGALTCAYWPVPATGTPHRIPASGAAPILVVGTTRDPATPYRWAGALASQLSSGRLLTYDGDGHTAYTRGSSCVDGAVNTYLLTSASPPASQKCA